ncbi:C-type lectin domain family 12 member A-like isoform X1 [Poecile atricapillus]|uniref:C-type lectin domain family 12 member A-like isoform X1 n=1 Tax=Poecile atricapillus TaxID=48891 RepID=UPI00273A3253|nr:C-type lectin domain family 12 member A-like isoform X1 [Poecile atricapillus]
MAGDVTYAAVAMLPRERPHTPSGTSNPGSTITYAELHVKRPHGNSRAETSAPDCRHRCSAWFYVALVLAVLVLILLGVVAIQAKQFLKGRAGKSESLPQYGLNTSSDISSERTVSAALLKWLMEELCENGQGTTCELCPAGWQLHRSRCYFFSEEARSWEDSQKNCLARKSQLLVIEDEIEMVSLAAALKACDRPQPNTSPRENGLDVKSTGRQARASPGKGSDPPCTRAEFGNISRAELKRRSTKGAKCGSQSSFDWEEEMLGLSTRFYHLALGREEPGHVYGLM